jgi:hypothetical protein
MYKGAVRNTRKADEAPGRCIKELSETPERLTKHRADV